MKSEITRREILAGSLALPFAGCQSRRTAAEPRMRLSCIPVTYFAPIRSGEMPLTEWLDFAVELGLDGVECGPPLIKPLGPVTPEEFRRLAEERKLAVSNYTAYSDFPHPDPEMRKREVAAALENVRVAQALGSSSVRALTGQQWPGVDEAQGITWVVDGIRRMAEEAERLGVRVNVENHTKASTWDNFDFAIKSDVFLKVMDGLKGVPVGVQFDTANPLVANEDVLEVFQKVRSRIGYVHFNDAKEKGVFEFVAVGTGISPIREVFKGLREQNYTGWIGIEEYSRTGKDGFRQAVKFSRQLLNEV